MSDPREFLIKVLTITGYEGDKKAFAQTIIDLALEDTVYGLLHSLPQTKQDKIARKWDNNADNHAALTSIVSHYFTKEQIEKAATEAGQKAVVAYINSIEDLLDDTQREKLKKLSEQVLT